MADKPTTKADDAAAGDDASGRASGPTEDKAVAGPRSAPRSTPTRRCPSCGGSVKVRTDGPPHKVGRLECGDCGEHFIAEQLD